MAQFYAKINGTAKNTIKAQGSKATGLQADIGKRIDLHLKRRLGSILRT